MAWQENDMCAAWARHAMCELAFRQHDHRDWLNEHVYCVLISTTLNEFE